MVGRVTSSRTGAESPRAADRRGPEIRDAIDLHAAVERLAQRGLEDPRRPALIGKDHERDHGDRGQGQENARHEGRQGAMATDPVPDGAHTSSDGRRRLRHHRGRRRTGTRLPDGHPERRGTTLETSAPIDQYDLGSPSTRSAR